MQKPSACGTLETDNPTLPISSLSFPPSFRSGCAYHFSLSWLITWFGHVVRSPDEGFRLVDVFLASHPLMPIYVAGAVSVDKGCGYGCGQMICEVP